MDHVALILALIYFYILTKIFIKWGLFMVKNGVYYNTIDDSLVILNKYLGNIFIITVFLQDINLELELMVYDTDLINYEYIGEL